MPEELLVEVCDIVWEAGIKTIPKKKKWKREKWLSVEGFQIAVKRREVKGKGEKKKIYPFECRVPKNSKERQESLLSDQCKEIEENNRMEKTRNLFKKIRDTKGTFHAKMGTIKDRNGIDITEAEDTKKRWQEYTEELYKKKIFMTQITTMVWSLI